MPRLLLNLEADSDSEDKNSRDSQNKLACHLKQCLQRYEKVTVILDCHQMKYDAVGL